MTESSACGPREQKVALVTGAGRRIGAEIARQLHAGGFRLALHCRRSLAETTALADGMNRKEPGSAAVFAAALEDCGQVTALAAAVLERFGRVDALVNNASSFYPTPLATATESQWDDLIGSNLKGPYFLCRALASSLQRHGGTIVNIADIHGRQPLKNHGIYCIAKAGNIMLTRSLALELGPMVRVNGIAPGAILWPESNPAAPAQAVEGTAAASDKGKQSILARVPMARTGSPQDIARLATFLISEPGYITGQVIAVDGGRSSGL